MTTPEMPKTIIEMFDLYVQQRVNLAVDGLLSRVAELETVLAAYRDIQGALLSRLQEDVKKLQTQPMATDGIDAAKFDAAMQDWLEYHALEDYLTARSISALLDGDSDFEDAVKSAVNELTFDVSVS